MLLRLSPRLAALVVPGVPPELGLDPGHQLQRIEGLGEVVVRPQGQPHDLVHVLHPGSEHQDGEQVRLPDLLAQSEAVHIREHHIQDGQVKRRGGHTGQGVPRAAELVV